MLFFPAELSTIREIHCKWSNYTIMPSRVLVGKLASLAHYNATCTCMCYNRGNNMGVGHYS